MNCADIEERRYEAKLAYLLLYYNLGGEMLYILKQRLNAQNICPQKAAQGECNRWRQFFNVQSQLIEFHSCQI